MGRFSDDPLEVCLAPVLPPLEFWGWKRPSDRGQQGRQQTEPKSRPLPCGDSSHWSYNFFFHRDFQSALTQNKKEEGCLIILLLLYRLLGLNIQGISMEISIFLLNCGQWYHSRKNKIAGRAAEPNLWVAPMKSLPSLLCPRQISYSAVTTDSCFWASGASICLQSGTLLAKPDWWRHTEFCEEPRLHQTKE